MSASTSNHHLSLIGYPQLLERLKEKIRSSQQRAAFAVNAELIQLYWEIGKEILQKKKMKGGHKNHRKTCEGP